MYNKGLQQGLTTRTYNKGLKQGFTTRVYNKGLQQGFTTRTYNKGLQQGYTTRTYKGLQQEFTTRILRPFSNLTVFLLQFHSRSQPNKTVAPDRHGFSAFFSRNRQRRLTSPTRISLAKWTRPRQTWLGPDCTRPPSPPHSLRYATLLVCVPGLPDGLFSNQKSQFG
jgi:hypothetical protein